MDVHSHAEAVGSRILTVVPDRYNMRRLKDLRHGDIRYDAARVGSQDGSSEPGLVWTGSSPLDTDALDVVRHSGVAQTVKGLLKVQPCVKADDFGYFLIQCLVIDKALLLTFMRDVHIAIVCQEQQELPTDAVVIRACLAVWPA